MPLYIKGACLYYPLAIQVSNVHIVHELS